MSTTRVMRAFSTFGVVFTALIAAATAQAQTTGDISGQVVDASGTPLASICVSAYPVPVPGQASVASAETDAAGDFALTVPPGTYEVQFDACGGQNYYLQWYPAQMSYRTATQLTVAAGQTVGGIDARMLAGGTITGTLLDARTQAPPPQLDIAVDAQTPGQFDNDPLADFAVSGNVAADGTYTLTGLPPGSYLVYFDADTSVNGVPSPYADAWYPDEPDPGHAATVRVQSGQTVSLGVELAELPGTVTGRVTNSSGAPLAGYIVGAGITEPDGSPFLAGPVPATTGPDGTFVLTGIPPGAWMISATPPGANGYRQSAPAIISAGATTPNIDFTYCIGTECPPTHLLALRTRIRDHDLLFAGRISDPAYSVLTIVLRGHIGRRKVSVRNRGYFVEGGSFDYSLLLPHKDWALRSGVLTIDFSSSEAARGGRFQVSVPSAFLAAKPKPR